MKTYMRALRVVIMLSMFYLGGFAAFTISALMYKAEKLEEDYVTSLKLEGLLFDTVIIVYLDADPKVDD